MFATLLGPLPHPASVVARPAHLGDATTVESAGVASAIADDVEAAVRIAVLAQLEAGLEPVTDGRVRDPGFDRLAGRLATGRPSHADAAARAVVRDWRVTAALTDRAVKQCLPGPIALARQLAESPGGGPWPSIETLASSLRGVVDALVEAGCRLIEIEEADPQLIGPDGTIWDLFANAHDRITDGVTGSHLSLSFSGGAVPSEGIDTVLDLPYASLAVDLIAGPGSWDLVARWPGGRGVVAGVLAARPVDEPKEVMLWAAHYAASTRGRGLDRVGLGSAGSFANLTWEAAVRKLDRLGEAARLATLPPGEELATSVNPGSVSARTAAVGRRPPASHRRPACRRPPTPRPGPDC